MIKIDQVSAENEVNVLSCDMFDKIWNQYVFIEIFLHQLVSKVDQKITWVSGRAACAGAGATLLMASLKAWSSASSNLRWHSFKTPFLRDKWQQMTAG